MIETENKTIIIIQARLGSSRLPKKMLLPFYGKETLLGIIIDKIKTVIPSSKIILATTNNIIDDSLEFLAIDKEVNCYRGHETDVLRRFIDTAKYYNSNNIIRICADNPFLDTELMLNIVMQQKENNIDYCSYSIDGIPAIKTHYGFFCEYVTLSALQKVLEKTSKHIYLEHVTNYIYEHPKEFEIKWLDPPIEIVKSGNVRLTVDTLEDFKICQLIYSSLIKNQKIITYKEVLSYISEKQELKFLMSQNILKNDK